MEAMSKSDEPEDFDRDKYKACSNHVPKGEGFDVTPLPCSKPEKVTDLTTSGVVNYPGSGILRTDMGKDFDKLAQLAV